MRGVKITEEERHRRAMDREDDEDEVGGEGFERMFFYPESHFTSTLIYLGEKKGKKRKRREEKERR